MENENRIWFLVLDNSSNLSKSSGAYKLKTIIKCKEMRTLADFARY